MSNLIVACTRDEAAQWPSQEVLHKVVARLAPRNISPSPPRVLVSEGLFVAVVNPNPAVLVREQSVCLGCFFGPPGEWWKVGKPIPDGTFALLRTNRDAVELAADAVGTRTLWYAVDDRILVASTSQRAIVMLLRTFRPKEDSIAWMLSSGCLGPDNSWDSRIVPLRGGQRLRFDRRRWKAAVTSALEPFAQRPPTTLSQAKSRVRGALDDTFSGLGADAGGWVVALSGGVDSRALLLGMNARVRPRCLTWGPRSLLGDSRSDPVIAKQLADHFSLDHTFYPTDSTGEGIEKALAHFVEMSEGRVDHLSGYMDGCGLWKHLHDDGVHGIVRGDQGFGSGRVRNEDRVRHRARLLLTRDFGELRGWELPGSHDQMVPGYLQRKNEETVETWRDRLHLQYRVPVVLAALNFIKSNYVEIMSPLLSRRILEVIYTLPDELRTDRKLLTELVLEGSPDIPFATHTPAVSKARILKRRSIHEFLIESIDTRDARDRFSDKFIEYLVQELERHRSDDRQAVTVLDRVRRRMRRFANRGSGMELNRSILAFRVYITCYAHKLLDEDARVL